MTYRVFTQEATPCLPLPRLLAQARRYFALSVNVDSRSDGDHGGERVRFELEPGAGAHVSVRARTTKPDDLGAAARAETRGNAAGMASLAKRCPTLWEVEADAGVHATTLHEFCALLASVALGPVLPPDESTLYGVRGAMERAKAARK
jgi:hypothetical protein